MTQTQRPLAPHLQIYRLQITSVLSILHRLTGIFMASGALVLVVWLSAISEGKLSYETIQAFFHHWLIQTYFFALGYSFFYHLCNGLRHLAWDAGYCFDLKTVHRSGWLAVGMSIILTLLTWFLIAGD